MSSSVVRSSILAAIAAQFPTWPYVETFGYATDNENLPDQWMSADFAADGETRMTIDVPNTWWLESGICRIVSVTLSGTGDAAAMVQAMAVMDYFRGWRDEPNRIRIDRVTPPAVMIEQSDGRWLTVAIDIFYNREFVV